MLLRALAPSLPIEAAPEPDRAAAPTSRLTVLLGAGASIFAGAPSTAELTDVVGARPLSGTILRALQRSGAPDANFEDALHVLEQLEALKAPTPDRAALSLRPFVTPLAALDEISLTHEAVRRERFDAIGAIADAFNGVTYDASWSTLARLFGTFLADFNLDVFTLNYDLLADVAVEGISRTTGKKWFNGFKTRFRDSEAEFNPGEYARWNAAWGPKYLTLQHLHGSLRYAYELGNRYVHERRFLLVEGEDFARIRQNWAKIKELAIEYPAEDFSGVAPIVSGLHKLEKLNAQPYANYYAAFNQAISDSPLLLIVGYGKGDDHINHWIREFTQIHNQGARIVEVTNSNNPSTFAMERITDWGDLHWTNYRGLVDVFESTGGVKNLAVTAGLHPDTDLPERLGNLAVPFFRDGVSEARRAH